MNTPKRIAVAILITLLGWALQQYAGLRFGLALGLIVGVIGARFVPGGSCAVSPTPTDSPTDNDSAKAD